MRTPVYYFSCREYDKEKLKDIINILFKNMNFKGKKVLLKPNMLQGHDPGQNVTTHPALVEACAERVLEKGGKCFIGDSPSGRGKENARRAASKTGFLGICEKLGIEFDFFDGQELVEKPVDNGVVFNSFFIPESFFSYDMIINLPKLKTHSLTVFTLGVKNMMGVIAGKGKTDFHTRALHPESFADAICDLYSVARPDFTVLDGIRGMQGPGPVSGIEVRAGFILGSEDANALDAAAETLCGADPRRVPITRKAAERGLGSLEYMLDPVLGSPPCGLKFKKPLTYRSAASAMVPRWLLYPLGLIYGYMRIPSVDREVCTGCAKCIQVCPADAIQFKKGRPRIIMKKCVKCYCCAERCPERAIGERFSRLP